MLYLLFFCYFISFFIIINLLFNNKTNRIPGFHPILSFIIIFVIIYIIANEPIILYSDKYVYAEKFTIIDFNNLLDFKDVGFYSLMLCIKQISDSSSVFFYVIGIIYLFGYYIFYKNIIPKNYVPILLLATVSSFGFYGYGVNTMRAGIGLCLVLITLNFRNKKILFALFFIISVFIHKSMLLPLLGYLLCLKIQDRKYFIYFWIFCLLVSFVNISFISTFLESILGGVDSRSNGYLGENNTELVYNSGFRIDFIIYSSIPIIVANFYFKRMKFNDVLYTNLFKMYLFTNAIWLLLIRIPFSDRIAYLSWFLIPILLLYPLLSYKIFKNQKNLIVIILLGIICFTSLMFF